MADDRYQNQPLLIRIYRWIRWKPLYFVKAGLDIFKTFFNKGILWDSYEKAYFRRSFIFSLILSEADTEMKHYYFLNEII